MTVSRLAHTKAVTTVITKYTRLTQARTLHWLHVVGTLVTRATIEVTFPAPSHWTIYGTGKGLVLSLRTSWKHITANEIDDALRNYSAIVRLYRDRDNISWSNEIHNMLV